MFIYVRRTHMLATLSIHTEKCNTKYLILNSHFAYSKDTRLAPAIQRTHSIRPNHNMLYCLCARMEKSVMKYHFSGLISMRDVCICTRLCVSCADTPPYTRMHCPCVCVCVSLCGHFDADEKKKEEEEERKEKTSKYNEISLSFRIMMGRRCERKKAHTLCSHGSSAHTFMGSSCRWKK